MNAIQPPAALPENPPARPIFRRIASGIKRHVKKLLQRPPPCVFGRLACLGQSVFTVRAPALGHPLLLNQQKSRCDMFMDWQNGAPRPDAAAVEPHLHRKFVLPMIQEQQNLPWLAHRGRPRLLCMDSFAELTDQKFVHKKSGWAFACHYRDLEHTPEFDQQFDCLGLLPVDQFDRAYRAFFHWFFEKYPKCPVVFLHFPAKLDSRPHFRERAEAIREILARQSAEFPLLKNVTLPDNLVIPAPGESYAYHFSQDTFDAFAKAWELAAMR